MERSAIICVNRSSGCAASIRQRCVSARRYQQTSSRYRSCSRYRRAARPECGWLMTVFSFNHCRFFNQRQRIASAISHRCIYQSLQAMRLRAFGNIFRRPSGSASGRMAGLSKTIARRPRMILKTSRRPAATVNGLSMFNLLAQRVRRWRSSLNSRHQSGKRTVAIGSPVRLAS